MDDLQKKEECPNRTVAVTFDPVEEQKKAINLILEPRARVVYLKNYDSLRRGEVLGRTEILFCDNFASSEISREEVSGCKALKFIQTLYAGVDKTPFENLPKNVHLASNAGAFAGPVSEHTMALTLTCAKKIFPKEDLMRKGRFDRTPSNKQLSGGICVVVGFGGIGRAVAQKMRAFGMAIHVVNRSGGSENGTDRAWSLSDIDTILPFADVVVLSIPLTTETRGLFNRRRLEIMKDDAILVNVSRAPIIIHDDLLEHLQSNPRFFFGSDVWWREPEGEEALLSNDPILGLPNVVATPHNADCVPGAELVATEKASENIRRYLEGKSPQCLVNLNDYLIGIKKKEIQDVTNR